MTAGQKELRARAVVLVADHYRLTGQQVRELPYHWFKTMLRHIASARPCDHPGRDG